MKKRRFVAVFFVFISIFITGSIILIINFFFKAEPDRELSMLYYSLAIKRFEQGNYVEFQKYADLAVKYRGLDVATDYKNILQRNFDVINNS